MNEDTPSSAGITFLNGIKNKRIVVIIGGIILAIGMAGMIITGSQILDIISGGKSLSQNPTLFRTEYAYLFVLVAGVVITTYGLVGVRRKPSVVSK